jgi:hypothetical protein
MKDWSKTHFEIEGPDEDGYVWICSPRSATCGAGNWGRRTLLPCGCRNGFALLTSARAASLTVLSPPPGRLSVPAIRLMSDMGGKRALDLCLIAMLGHLPSGPCPPGRPQRRYFLGAAKAAFDLRQATNRRSAAPANASAFLFAMARLQTFQSASSLPISWQWRIIRWLTRRQARLRRLSQPYPS